MIGERSEPQALESMILRLKELGRGGVMLLSSVARCQWRCFVGLTDGWFLEGVNAFKVLVRKRIGIPNCVDTCIFYGLLQFQIIHCHHLRN